MAAVEKEATVLSELFPDAAAHIEAKREDTRMAVATLLQMSPFALCSELSVCI